MSKEPRPRMSKKTKAFITGAVFILAILVLILCIMSGAMKFTPSTTTVEPTATPLVTAPPATPTPDPTPQQTEEPEEKEFSVTVFANHGGTADPSGTTIVKEGKSITIYFQPDEGFRVDTVTVNGELVDAADSYTIDAVTGDMTIDVSFDTDTPETTTPDSPQTSEPVYNYGMP